MTPPKSSREHDGRRHRAASDRCVPLTLAAGRGTAIVVSLRDCAYFDRLTVDALVRLKQTVGGSLTVVLPARVWLREMFAMHDPQGCLTTVPTLAQAVWPHCESDGGGLAVFRSITG